jgi:hypothetical protein
MTLGTALREAGCRSRHGIANSFRAGTRGRGEVIERLWERRRDEEVPRPCTATLPPHAVPQKSGCPSLRSPLRLCAKTVNDLAPAQKFQDPRSSSPRPRAPARKLLTIPREEPNPEPQRMTRSPAPPASPCPAPRGSWATRSGQHGRHRQQWGGCRQTDSGMTRQRHHQAEMASALRQ